MMQPGMMAYRQHETGLAVVGQRFTDLQTLTVKQRKNWWELVFTLDQKNRYVVLGNRLGAAFEVEEQGEGFGALVQRLFLGTARPFTAFVVDLRRDSLAMRLHRRWRWFFPLLDIHDGDDKPVASIEAQWAWFQRRYTIRDAQGATLGEIIGPFFKPWTFELTVNQQVIGHIKKKWSGLLNEAFTSADNFEVEFGAEVDPKWKALALAGAVLIDVVHFERAKNNWR
jgi:uncharacterized protein YxjI